ncbi:MAG: SPOR domain-containing protein [Candidatus Cryptobacteroides sp.]
MKKIIAITSALAIVLLGGACGNVSAQTRETDSLVIRQTATLDSALVGKSVFNILDGSTYGDGEVKIHQSQAITDAMRRHIENNPSRKLSGYRVRIFFVNSQNARSTSEQVMKKFMLSYPGVPAYRSYQNPFFKVVAGDFRTKSEAMEFLQKVKPSYPDAIVVRENIEFPAPDRQHTYTIDTVKVSRSFPLN